ncbi:MAG: hypothetical protein ACFFC7_24590 [Candidatus Hermodarchaeota archaeon]
MEMTDAHDLAEWGIEYTLTSGVSYAEARVISGQKTGFFLKNSSLISWSEGV